MRPSIALRGLRTKQVSHGWCRAGHMQLHPDLWDSHALHGPSPARSPMPGLQPKAFRHRCIKQVFIGFYWWLEGCSRLQCINGPNSLQCPKSRLFAIWFHSSSHQRVTVFFPQHLMLGLVTCLTLVNGMSVCDMWLKACKVGAPSFLLSRSFPSPWEHTQASLLVPGENKRHQEQSFPDAPSLDQPPLSWPADPQKYIRSVKPPTLGFQHFCDPS